ncbi:MAG: trypsin-like peptidase domain-containing protein [Lachnospiraceae bacterium]|nr:trypsin-like peptidase domain-containing protein [Lachnospiraceae bacterium]
MYEYYDYENKVIPDEKEKLQSQMKAEAVKDAKAKKKEKRHKWFMCVAYALVFGLIAGGTFQGVNLAGDLIREKTGLAGKNVEEDKESGKKEATLKTNEEKSNDTETEKESRSKASISKAETASLAATGTLDVSTVAGNVMPSIVSITNKGVQEVRSLFGRGIREYESMSAGSGIIIGENDDELLLVTNNHVVEGAKELSVCFIDEEVCSAVVKGTDPENDLAVISVKLSDIKDSTMDSIAIATMGDSEDLVIGQQVVAIGNALGYGQSVTTGIISALEREVEIDNLASKLIQTDAAINPGNSGGALLNMRGEVIGINSAKFASSEIEGMGYAIPISTATPIIEELMNRETRELVDKKDASYLGISGVSVTEEVSKTYNIPKGIYISEAEENGPADKAGIEKGDVIRKFGGVTVSTMNDIKEQLLYYKAGEEVEILLQRSDGSEYKDVTVKVTLGKKSDSPLANEEEEEDEGTEQPSGNNGNNGNNGFGGDFGEYYIDPFSIFGF